MHVRKREIALVNKPTNWVPLQQPGQGLRSFKIKKRVHQFFAKSFFSPRVHGNTHKSFTIEINHMNRNKFLKQTLSVGALAALSPVANNLFAKTILMAAGPHILKEELLARMITANDGAVKKLL